jgi:hypothetical protein
LAAYRTPGWVSPNDRFVVVQTFFNVLSVRLRDKKKAAACRKVIDWGKKVSGRGDSTEYGLHSQLWHARRRCGCRYLLQAKHRFISTIDRHKNVIVVIAGNHIAGDFRLRQLSTDHRNKSDGLET